MLGDHRIAISNSRLISLTTTHVSFQWKHYADNGKSKIMALTIEEFIRRFLLHVLPPGFVRIRYYGFLANCTRAVKLQLCRDQTDPAKAILGPDDPTQAEEEELGPVKEPSRLCPVCHKGHFAWFMDLPRPHRGAAISTADLRLTRAPDPGGGIANAA